MHLSIKYEGLGSHRVEGAFIRGAVPRDWLHEIGGWQAPLEKLSCFVLAGRKDMRSAAGLFVVFPEDLHVVLPDHIYPYRKIAGKLFIPADAGLSPAVSGEELSSLLIWDIQFFHPAHGFTGFDLDDKLAWEDLLDMRAPEEKDWSFASPGLPDLPSLEKISISQPTEDEMFESVKDSVNSKPIEELTKDDRKKGLFTSVRDSLYLTALKSMLRLMNGFIKILPAGRGGPGPAVDLSGPMDRMMNWVNARMEELEKRRAGEIQRLLDLFEKDTDEALQYAIPLSSPYLDRGTAPPSDKLGRRDTQFNLGRLGGGGRADAWNVDAYYGSLRSKYERAAEQALASGDFKKAAYIYAHLMGNYVAAAGALEQGGYFLEAARLYKEHLDNIPAAAECLERGGLLPEAILLYEELDRQEKCGDLHRHLGQEERALRCFEQAALQASGRKDYKEEARILKDKVKDRTGAKKALLKGWQADRQPEYFLKEYFDMQAGEDPRHLHLEVRKAYWQKDISYRKEAFLNVIARVNEQYKGDAMDDTCRDIAFEIVSQAAKEGRTNVIHMLRKFIPDDPLLSPDCYRWLHQYKQPDSKPPVTQQLTGNTTWQRAVLAQGQVLVWGVSEEGILLARGNWKGQWTYDRWSRRLYESAQLVVTGGQDLLYFLLYIRGVDFPGKKILPPDSTFSQVLVLDSPSWLPAGTKGIAVTTSGIAIFHNERHDFFLSRYTMDGRLTGSHRCVIDNLPVNLSGFTDVTREMIWLDGHYYLPAGLVLLRISENGEMAASAAESWIKSLQSISIDGRICLALLTSASCHIVDPSAFDDPQKRIFLQEDTEASCMGVTDHGVLALAGRDKLSVYTFTENAPKLLLEMPIEQEPIAILPTARRHQLGLITAAGIVTLVDVPPGT